MKNFLVVTLALASSLCGSISVQAQSGASPAMEITRSVPWREVPEPAQRTLQMLSGKDVLIRTEQGVMGGQTVYRAAAERNGVPVDFVVTADGGTITPRNVIAWNELPIAVQQSYSSLNNQQALQEIVAENQSGQMIYDFSLDNNGSQSNMQLAQDGSIMGYQPQAGDIINESAGAERPTQRSTETEIPFENLSQAAQKTVMRVTGGGAIQSITTEAVKGIVCYDVKYNTGDGMGGVCISNDGQIVK